MSEISQAIDIFNLSYPYALGIIAGHGGTRIILLIQKKIHLLRLIVDQVDNFMTDPKITEDQAQQQWSNLKLLVGKK